ncbi:D-alanyl-D-alanine carboxypeptidase [Patescibacteria group bacterium]|nr:D-alanyl-D-alanine carboxypeptidase [Patescibacteria group bacterium]
MFIDAAKIALAGLMVILDLLGIGNSNQVVLDMAGRMGFDNYYQIETKENAGNTEVASVEITLPKYVPQIVDSLNYPVIEAEVAVVMDVATSGVLYEKNVDRPRAMASLTKLMTALVALEKLDPNQVITIKGEDVDIEPMVMGLIPGEEIYLIDVVRGLLIGSGNDAALTLARVGGGGSVNDFVEMMNQMAVKLGLENTSFANPHGLDDSNQYSSAKDLALLTKYAIINYPIIAEIVNIKEYTVHALNGGYVHYLDNTNKLLDSYLNVQGVKTGFTDNAGQVLITMAEENGHRVICVVMNSPDRFQESKMLLDWAFRNHYWE